VTVTRPRMGGVISIRAYAPVPVVGIVTDADGNNTTLNLQQLGVDSMQQQQHLDGAGGATGAAAAAALQQGMR
jgi:shikimate 5-dehydrogenase